MIQDPDFFQEVIDLLHRLEIEYMVVGSLSSIYYGEVRTTNDVDIVIGPERPQIDELVRSFERAGYVVSEDAAREAFTEKSVFNVIHTESAAKIDLIIRPTNAFDAEEFARRKIKHVADTNAYVISAEGCILSKLRWAKQSGSEMQQRDVVGVLLRQWHTLDWDYLKQWAMRLGVDEMLGTTAEAARQIREA